jgi:hypothetical protein
MVDGLVVRKDTVDGLVVRKDMVDGLQEWRHHK